MTTEKLLYSRVEAAELLGISRAQLDKMTKAGTGPKPSHLGARVLFHRDALTQFAEQVAA